MKIDVIDKELTKQDFHQIYYDSNVWSGPTTFLGLPILKCPMDLWMYQQIIHKVKPKVIIETGTHYGASAYWLLCCMNMSGIKNKMVITIDIEQKITFKEPEITQIIGKSTHPDAVYTCMNVVGQLGGPVMVILDSDHSKESVLAELNLYAKFVTSGSYLIVEDTNINGHPVCEEWGDGPKEALDEWILENQKWFEVDRECEQFMVTFNPGGYLRRR